MKNPDLCQRAHCKEPYTKIVHGWTHYFGGKGWALKVCDAHAVPYTPPGQDSCGNWCRIEDRRDVKCGA